MRTWRPPFIALATAALGFLVMREATVRSNIATYPERAVAAWSAHPDARFAAGMRAIEAATQAGRPVDHSLTDSLIEAARRAPLSPEPFLVRGLVLQEVGDEAEAGAAFMAAEQRDPRSVAAHFFLADHFARSGRIGRSLTELGRVIRLVPGSSGQLAPRIAASLKSVGGVEGVRALVADNPQLRDDLLIALATDASNADIIASLAVPAQRQSWRPVLVNSLIAAGDYHRAFTLWARDNGVVGQPLLIDPRFSLDAKPPFGWEMSSGPAGAVEPADGGGLHLIYYRRQPMVAASQIMILPSGRYLLSFSVTAVSGERARAQWRIVCLPGERIIASVGLDAGRPGTRVRAAFDIPGGCSAQRLQLIGAPADSPQTLDAIVRDLTVTRR